MQNAKEYKPIVYELVDMCNRQKELAKELSKKISKADGDEKMLAGLTNYLEKLDALEGALKDIVEPVEVSLYKDSAEKFAR